MTAKPADLLRALQDRVEQLAAPVPESSASAETQAIAVEVAHHRLLIPMAQVAEVVDLPPTTRLPGTASWLIGVANVRGEILPVVDLGLFLGNPASSANRRCKVVSFQRAGLNLGAVVDRVVGMRQLDGLDAASASSDAEISALTSATLMLNAEAWGVLDLDRLVHSDQFKRVAT